MAQFQTQIAKRITELRKELDQLEAARAVFERFTGRGKGKLNTMDKHAAALGAGNGHSNGHRRSGERTPAQQAATERMRQVKLAKRAAQRDAANGPPPPFDLNKLPIEQLHTLKAAKSSLLGRARPLFLLDAMIQAGVPATHENYSYVYCDVLKWGSRPLAQAPRYGLAKHTEKSGWRLLPAGAAQLAEARRLLAERST